MVAKHDDNFYRSVYEHSMDAVLFTQPDGRVLAANRAACELFNLTEEDICGIGRAGLVDINSPDLPRMLEERAQLGASRGELLLIRSDGSRFPAEVTSALFRDASGELRTVTTIRDSSEIKQARQVQEKLLSQIIREAAEIEAVLASQDDVILMYDLNMNVRRANPSFQKQFEFDPVGLNLREIIQRVSYRHLDGRPLALAEAPTPRALRGEEVRNMLCAVTGADGANAIVETSSMPLVVQGQIEGVVTIWHDVTELRHTEENLRQSLQEIEDLYNHAPCGYHSLDKDGYFLRINATELSWLGYSRDEVVGKLNWKDIVAPAYIKILEENFPLFLKQGFIHNLEYEMIRKDGSTFIGLVNATAVYDANGNYQHSRGTVLDITERKRLEMRLAQQAQLDVLTGLNNRRHFFELAEHEFSRSKRFGSPLALLITDVDHFKQFNDTYGHDAGDAILKELSRISLHTLREIDIAGRLGGEEFVALLPGVSGAQAMRAAERLRTACANSAIPVADRKSVSFTVSIGVTCRLEQDQSVDAMLKRADIALYAAKDAGRNCVRHKDLV